MVESFEAVLFGSIGGRWTIVDRQLVAELSDGLRWGRERLSNPALCSVYPRLCARVISSADGTTAESLLRQLSRRAGTGKAAPPSDEHHKRRKRTTQTARAA